MLPAESAHMVWLACYRTHPRHAQRGEVKGSKGPESATRSRQHDARFRCRVPGKQVSRFLKLSHWSQPLRKSVDREMEIEKLRVINVECDR